MTNRTPAWYRRRALARGAATVVLTAASLAVGFIYIIGVVAVFDAVTGR